MRPLILPKKGVKRPGAVVAPSPIRGNARQQARGKWLDQMDFVGSLKDASVEST